MITSYSKRDWYAEYGTCVYHRLRACGLKRYLRGFQYGPQLKSVYQNSGLNTLLFFITFFPFHEFLIYTAIKRNHTARLSARDGPNTL